MRITRETLLKIARDTAAERVRVSRRLVCVYLTGSLLREDPLLGGSADIDLFCIHDAQPAAPREVVRLTDEVHLDIAHLSQAEFQQPRRLRQDAWLGSYICSHPLVLHDSAHWFDMQQAIISAQFFQPENVILRARGLAEEARQRWMTLHERAGDLTPAAAAGTYLKALEQAANSAAVVSGAPLTERRFLLHFAQRAQQLGREDLSSGLVAQLLGSGPQPSEWPDWLPGWKAALQQAGALPACPASLHPARLGYYQRAVLALLESTPPAALWLLLRTWTRAAALLPVDSAPHQQWLAAAAEVGLYGGALVERVQALDGYLDSVEETLDAWANKYGI